MVTESLVEKYCPVDSAVYLTLDKKINTALDTRDRDSFMKYSYIKSLNYLPSCEILENDMEEFIHFREGEECFYYESCEITGKTHNSLIPVTIENVIKKDSIHEGRMAPIYSYICRNSATGELYRLSESDLQHDIELSRKFFYYVVGCGKYTKYLADIPYADSVVTLVILGIRKRHSNTVLFLSELGHIHEVDILYAKSKVKNSYLL